jgi:hypothetical protein
LSRPDPDDIIAKHGAVGERFVGLLRDSAAMLFDVANRYHIAAEHEQTGWVQPVHSPGRIKIAERRVRQWWKFGAPVELLSRDQVRDMLGSDAWFGFWNRRRPYQSAGAGTGAGCAPCSASAPASMRARQRKLRAPQRPLGGENGEGEISGRAWWLRPMPIAARSSILVVPEMQPR